MNWSEQMDIYCERVDFTYWSEPLNALTNASFILAGLWAIIEIRRRGVHHIGIWIPTILAFAIGIGSYLFHTHATQWASLADVLPIVLFVISYAVVALALIGEAGPSRVILYLIGVVLFLVLIGYLTNLSGLSINGSEAYMPALALMIGIAAITALRGHPATRWFVAATLAFILSLTFRSIDIALCDVFPTGTHIFWHTLNGLVIALLLQALIRNSKRTLS